MSKDNGAGFRIGRLGHITLGTADLDAMLEHYAGRLGLSVTELSPDAAYLTAGIDHHCLVIETGSRGHVATGFEIGGGLDDAGRALRAHGITFSRRTDPEPGIPAVLEVASPDGNTIQLYEAQAQSGMVPVHELRPRKLGHVARFADDIAVIRDFYLDKLGLRFGDSVAVNDREYFLFMRVGPDHHTVNFMENPDESGLHHFAFEARDIDHIKNLCDALARDQVTLEWGVGRHGPGHNVFSYHRDPDGNLVELFTDLDVMFDEDLGYYEPRPWHQDVPQRPKVWDKTKTPGNAWGPGPIDPELLKAPAWVTGALSV